MTSPNFETERTGTFSYNSGIMDEANRERFFARGGQEEMQFGENSVEVPTRHCGHGGTSRTRTCDILRVRQTL